jgi:hypothetical protein
VERLAIEICAAFNFLKFSTRHGVRKRYAMEQPTILRPLPAGGMSIAPFRRSCSVPSWIAEPNE